MAGVKISNLPAVPVAPQITDIFPEVQPAVAGTTYKVTFQQVSDLFKTTLITPANGGIIYSDATGLAVLAPTATANQLLQSGSNSAPHWSTSTYPTTNAINTLLYASSANVMAALATANDGALVTGATGIPSISSTLPNAVQDNITRLGTVGTVAGALNMSSHLINNVTDPVSAQDAATKAYVDSVAQGFTIIGACRLATTTALTVTYANGASGVGATLTNAGAQVALSIDGVATVVNDRILVKNQASSLQNGVYTVTNIGSGATNWVMTRATDYDQPSEIQPGDLVLITAGTANANSSWVETATVTTIGVDAISFSQFSASLPISLANGGTGAALTASTGGIFYSGASAGAILSGTATARQMLQSGASAAPAWSTTTWPATTTINRILWSSAANVISDLATTNSSVLVTDSGGVPSLSSTLPAFTTSSITFSPTTGGIVGTTTNDNAAAGKVGEFTSASIAFASAVACTNNTPRNVTSISLTAGDWDVFGSVGFTFNQTTASYYGWISTTSATLPDLSLAGTIAALFAGTGVATTSPPALRVSVASTTTVYLSAEASGTFVSASAYGIIQARRVR